VEFEARVGLVEGGDDHGIKEGVLVPRRRDRVRVVRDSLEHLCGRSRVDERPVGVEQERLDPIDVERLGHLSSNLRTADRKTLTR
jgi:hypothetical protein